MKVRMKNLAPLRPPAWGIHEGLPHPTGQFFGPASTRAAMMEKKQTNWVTVISFSVKLLGEFPHTVGLSGKPDLIHFGGNVLTKSPA